MGLALSGGSARGFAHIGVLRVLEEAGLGVDAVAGTSMGAVVGALYSVGYSPSGLADVAAGRDWADLFRESVGRPSVWPGGPSEAERHQLSFPLRGGRPSLPTGLVAGQRVTQALARLTWHVHPVTDFSRLPIPFRAVATDLETGEAVVLSEGFLPLALRASLAVPSVFAPVKMGSRYLIDGGVARNLPAQDVRAMGADVVVCSDVTEPPEPADSVGSFLDVLEQTLSFQVERRAVEQRKLCDVLVRPRLGGLDTYGFDRAEEWTARGEEAARRHLGAIRALARRRGDGSRRSDGPPASDSVVVERVRVPDVPLDQARYLRRLLGAAARGRTTVGRIDEAVARVYDAGLYVRVVYRLDEPGAGADAPPPGPGAEAAAAAPDRASRGSEDGSPVAGPPRRDLVLETVRGGRDELRIGVRFESEHEVSLLLTADLHRLLDLGGFTQLEARLGEELHLEARHRLRPAFAPGFLLGVRGGYRRSPVELPAAPDGSPEQAAVEVGEASVLLGKLLGESGVAGLEVRAESFGQDPDQDGDGTGGDGTMVTVGARLAWDSRDRTAFAGRGVRADLRVEAAEEALGSDRSLARTWADVSAHLPLAPGWVAHGRATLGTTAGAEPPPHRIFRLGGMVPSQVFPRHLLTLPGLPAGRLAGSHVQRTGAGLRVEVAEDVFVGGSWAAGDARSSWALRPGDWVHGFALELGVRTALGPVRLSLADATAAGGPRLAVDAGGRF